ncbi:sterile alpha motif domain-containing protein 3-like [Archocentrus centrarchus]|uniref:sterile alpha motif domain-containing protein 3-like n=1 Tax=Archocentrus centrarchus TaxID=63155 RepID=UPI0011E9F5AC|nr:sterile alpha motif domain-containing protein 3-like [Archocentrus centrarchus]
MEPTERLKLRVILDPDNAERLILPSCPSSVQALIDEIRTRLKLTFDFRLQFHDPDFGNALCNLVEIEHLPSTASVKVVRLVELDQISTSTDDTIILTDSTDSTDTPERISRWPEVFIVPIFSYEMEHVLREGNAAYEKDGTVIRLPRDQKHNILKTMGEEIFRLKAYPSSTQIGKAAEALVRKHPCLKERNSDTGWEGWKNSLRHKIGNQRKKFAKAGIKDVAVNSGKRSRTNPEGAAPRANIKRPRRGEVNFLPSYPSGETRESLETRRVEMVEEFQKTSGERAIPLIHQHMMRTFALRREEIITTSPPVSELKERWPALFCETQLYCEFHRITNQHLPHVFYAALDEYAPKLIGLYKKKKTGRVGEKMDQLMLAYEKQDKNDIHATRTTALAGLPIYLKEDSSGIFKTCKDEMEFHEGAVALVADVDEEEAPAGVPFSPRQVFIVLEDQVVMTYHSWTDALVCLFGLIYALHLSYPVKCISFFEFIQVVLLKLNDERKQLKPKLQTLKNELV